MTTSARFSEKKIMTDIVTEERLFGSVGGYTISGQADVYNKKDGMLKDYKVT